MKCDQCGRFARFDAYYARWWCDRCERQPVKTRTDGAAVQCPTCLAKFGGMTVCPWDGSPLIPLPDADPTAVAFYNAIA